MKLLFVFIFVNVVSISVCSEKSDSYHLPIVRNGKKETRVARNFWGGEYPAPIIDVHSAKKGTTKIKAFKSLRDIDKSVECTIQNGLYHPWAKPKASAIDFYQIVANTEYTASKSVTTGSFKLKKGEKISRVIYLSEGSCEGATGAKQEKRIEFNCDDANSAGMIQTAGAQDKFEEQWIFLKCEEGYKAFVRDEELLKHPGVKTGEVAEYGSVKASEK